MAKTALGMVAQRSWLGGGDPTSKSRVEDLAAVFGRHFFCRISVLKTNIQSTLHLQLQKKYHNAAA
jgi:hypothetical protein